MGVDFMRVMRICACCKTDDNTVAWSENEQAYLCDECFEDLGGKDEG